MTDPKDAPDLEAALVDRAERLASEYLAQGQEGRKAILAEERERLEQREARITKEATGNAERLRRRREQAAKLRLHGDVDRQRWTTIQSVIDDLPERLAALVDDKAAYAKLLEALLAQAANSIDAEELVAEVNERDHAEFGKGWDAICKKAAPGRRISLVPEPLDCIGGVRVSASDNRTRVDATFEGRMERFSDDLTRAISAELFQIDIRPPG